MFELIREYAGKYDRSILQIDPEFGADREGDIPHSHASIEKAKSLLGYSPTHDVVKGLEEAVDWFWKNM
jgi:UDP-N-acetylglucosamine 4-epimerase